jgi:hypothetical protein
VEVHRSGVRLHNGLVSECAFFKGLIDIHTPGSGNDGMVAPGISTTNPSGAAFAIQA